MTWLKLDDKLTTHPKWLQISVWADDIWLHASLWCASHNNDGVIPETSLHLHTHKVIRDSRVLGPGVDMVDSAIRELVRAGLWRRRPKRDGGGWDIVNWLDYQPSKQEVQARKEKTEEEKRRQALHRWLHNNPYGKRVRDAVMLRDGLWCRYCGVLCTVGKDQKGPGRRTFDLIDPANIDVIPWAPPQPLVPAAIRQIADMWATACGYCNACKGHRTPEEADMPLLPPAGFRSNQFGQDRAGSDPIGSASDHAVGTGRAGTDRAWSGTDGPGLVGAVVAAAGIAHVSDPVPFAEPGLDDAYFASLLAGR